MIVNDQIHLSLVLSHQALHEIQQHISRKALLEHHKAKLSLLVSAEIILQRKRDQSPPMTGVVQTTKTFVRRMVRAQSHSSPIHQGMFALCTSVQQRIDSSSPIASTASGSGRMHRRDAAFVE